VAEYVLRTSSPILAGLQGCCPRCGKGKLFAGFLKLAPYCSRCGLWGPLILITGLAPLRPLKGLMIALQYHHKAGEGR
jgi:uncharacterized protein (DUF983 family)